MLIEIAPTEEPVNTTPAPQQASDTPELTDKELYNGQSDQDFVDDAVDSLLQDPEMDLLYRDVKSVRDRLTMRKINERNVKFMHNTLSEYLDSFVIFGYDLTGRRVIVQHTHKQGDVDSMQKYLEHAVNSNVLYANYASQQAARDPDDEDEDEDDD